MTETTTRELARLSHDELLAKISRDLDALRESHEQADYAAEQDALADRLVWRDSRRLADDELAELDADDEREAGSFTLGTGLEHYDDVERLVPWAMDVVSRNHWSAFYARDPQRARADYVSVLDEH